MKEIEVSILKEVLEYKRDTGLLIWKHRQVEMFSCVAIQKSWNTRCAGKAAGSLTSAEYLQIRLLGSRLQAHRVAYAIHYGVWPEDQIDHINGVRDDNRIVNLRDVSHQDNLRNQKRCRANTSGVSGVGYHTRDNVWYARLGSTHLGNFKDRQDAVSCRKQAELDYGYHENHGRP